MTAKSTLQPIPSFRVIEPTPTLTSFPTIADPLEAGPSNHQGLNQVCGTSIDDNSQRSLTGSSSQSGNSRSLRLQLSSQGSRTCI